MKTVRYDIWNTWKISNYSIIKYAKLKISIKFYKNPPKLSLIHILSMFFWYFFLFGSSLINLWEIFKNKLDTILHNDSMKEDIEYGKDLYDLCIVV